MQIREIMTPCPRHIEGCCSVSDALFVMAERGIRHLPVVDHGNLVGVLTERDAKLAQMIERVSGKPPLTADVCCRDPYVVFDDTDISEVSRIMAERKLDYALVADKDAGCVGILTTVDICRLVHSLFQELRLQNAEGSSLNPH